MSDQPRPTGEEKKKREDATEEDTPRRLAQRPPTDKRADRRRVSPPPRLSSSPPPNRSPLIPFTLGPRKEKKKKKKKEKDDEEDGKKNETEKDTARRSSSSSAAQPPPTDKRARSAQSSSPSSRQPKNIAMTTLSTGRPDGKKSAPAVPKRSMPNPFVALSTLSPSIAAAAAAAAAAPGGTDNPAAPAGKPKRSTKSIMPSKNVLVIRSSASDQSASPEQPPPVKEKKKKKRDPKDDDNNPADSSAETPLPEKPTKQKKKKKKKKTEEESPIAHIPRPPIPNVPVAVEVGLSSYAANDTSVYTTGTSLTEKQLSDRWVTYETLSNGQEINLNGITFKIGEEIANTNNSCIRIITYGTRQKKFVLKAIKARENKGKPSYNWTERELCMEKLACRHLQMFKCVPMYVASDNVRALVYEYMDISLKGHCENLRKQRGDASFISDAHCYTVLRWTFSICSFLYMVMVYKKMMLLDFKSGNILINIEEDKLFFIDNGMLFPLSTILDLRHIFHVTDAYNPPRNTYWSKHSGFYYNRVVGIILLEMVYGYIPDEARAGHIDISPPESPEVPNEHLKKLITMCFEYDAKTYRPTYTWWQICNYVFRMFNLRAHQVLLPDDEDVDRIEITHLQSLATSAADFMQIRQALKHSITTMSAAAHDKLRDVGFNVKSAAVSFEQGAASRDATMNLDIPEEEPPRVLSMTTKANDDSLFLSPPPSSLKKRSPASVELPAKQPPTYADVIQRPGELIGIKNDAIDKDDTSGTEKTTCPVFPPQKEDLENIARVGEQSKAIVVATLEKTGAERDKQNPPPPLPPITRDNVPSPTLPRWQLYPEFSPPRSPPRSVPPPSRPKPPKTDREGPMSVPAYPPPPIARRPTAPPQKAASHPPDAPVLTDDDGGDVVLSPQLTPQQAPSVGGTPPVSTPPSGGTPPLNSDAAARLLFHASPATYQVLSDSTTPDDDGDFPVTLDYDDDDDDDTPANVGSTSPTYQHEKMLDNYAAAQGNQEEVKEAPGNTVALLPQTPGNTVALLPNEPEQWGGRKDQDRYVMTLARYVGDKQAETTVAEFQQSKAGVYGVLSFTTGGRDEDTVQKDKPVTVPVHAMLDKRVTKDTSNTAVNLQIAAVIDNFKKKVLKTFSNEIEKGEPLSNNPDTHDVAVMMQVVSNKIKNLAKKIGDPNVDTTSSYTSARIRLDNNADVYIEYPRVEHIWQLFPYQILDPVYERRLIERDPMRLRVAEEKNTRHAHLICKRCSYLHVYNYCPLYEANNLDHDLVDWNECRGKFDVCTCLSLFVDGTCKTQQWWWHKLFHDKTLDLSRGLEAEIYEETQDILRGLEDVLLYGNDAETAKGIKAAAADTKEYMAGDTLVNMASDFFGPDETLIKAGADTEKAVLDAANKPLPVYDKNNMIDIAGVMHEDVPRPLAIEDYITNADSYQPFHAASIAVNVLDVSRSIMQGNLNSEPQALVDVTGFGQSMIAYGSANSNAIVSTLPTDMPLPDDLLNDVIGNKEDVWPMITQSAVARQYDILRETEGTVGALAQYGNVPPPAPDTPMMNPTETTVPGKDILNYPPPAPLDWSVAAFSRLLPPDLGSLMGEVPADELPDALIDYDAFLEHQPTAEGTDVTYILEEGTEERVYEDLRVTGAAVDAATAAILGVDNDETAEVNENATIEEKAYDGTVVVNKEEEENLYKGTSVQVTQYDPDNSNQEAPQPIPLNPNDPQVQKDNQRWHKENIPSTGYTSTTGRRQQYPPNRKSAVPADPPGTSRAFKGARHRNPDKRKNGAKQKSLYNKYFKMRLSPHIMNLSTAHIKLWLQVEEACAPYFRNLDIRPFDHNDVTNYTQELLTRTKHVFRFGIDGKTERTMYINDLTIYDIAEMTIEPELVNKLDRFYSCTKRQSQALTIRQDLCQRAYRNYVMALYKRSINGDSGKPEMDANVKWYINWIHYRTRARVQLKQCTVLGNIEDYRARNRSVNSWTPSQIVAIDPAEYVKIYNNSVQRLVYRENPIDILKKLLSGTASAKGHVKDAIKRVMTPPPEKPWPLDKPFPDAPPLDPVEYVVSKNNTFATEHNNDFALEMQLVRANVMSNEKHCTHTWGDLVFIDLSPLTKTLFMSGVVTLKDDESEEVKDVVYRYVAINTQSPYSLMWEIMVLDFDRISKGNYVLRGKYMISADIGNSTEEEYVREMYFASNRSLEPHSNFTTWPSYAKKVVKEHNNYYNDIVSASNVIKLLDNARPYVQTMTKRGPGRAKGTAPLKKKPKSKLGSRRRRQRRVSDDDDEEELDNYYDEPFDDDDDDDDDDEDDDKEEEAETRKTAKTVVISSNKRKSTEVPAASPAKQPLRAPKPDVSPPALEPSGKANQKRTGALAGLQTADDEDVTQPGSAPKTRKPSKRARRISSDDDMPPLADRRDPTLPQASQEAVELLEKTTAARQLLTKHRDTTGATPATPRRLTAFRESPFILDRDVFRDKERLAAPFDPVVLGWQESYQRTQTVISQNKFYVEQPLKPMDVIAVKGRIVQTLHNRSRAKETRLMILPPITEFEPTVIHRTLAEHSDNSCNMFVIPVSLEEQNFHMVCVVTTTGEHQRYNFFTGSSAAAADTTVDDWILNAGCNLVVNLIIRTFGNFGQQVAPKRLYTCSQPGPACVYKLSVVYDEYINNEDDIHLLVDTRLIAAMKKNDEEPLPSIDVNVLRTYAALDGMYGVVGEPDDMPFKVPPHVTGAPRHQTDSVAQSIYDWATYSRYIEHVVSRAFFKSNLIIYVPYDSRTGAVRVRPWTRLIIVDHEHILFVGLPHLDRAFMYHHLPEPPSAAVLEEASRIMDGLPICPENALPSVKFRAKSDGVEREQVNFHAMRFFVSDLYISTTMYRNAYWMINSRLHLVNRLKKDFAYFVALRVWYSLKYSWVFCRGHSVDFSAVVTPTAAPPQMKTKVLDKIVTRFNMLTQTCGDLHQNNNGDIYFYPMFDKPLFGEDTNRVLCYLHMDRPWSPSYLRGLPTSQNLLCRTRKGYIAYAEVRVVRNPDRRQRPLVVTNVYMPNNKLHNFDYQGFEKQSTAYRIISDERTSKIYRSRDNEHQINYIKYYLNEDTVQARLLDSEYYGLWCMAHRAKLIDGVDFQYNAYNLSNCTRLINGLQTRIDRMIDADDDG